MDRALEELVWRRARRRCEYCQMPHEYERTTFEIDHVIATSHGGTSRALNLCLACFSCNSFKGTNLAGIDPKTKKGLIRGKRTFACKGVDMLFPSEVVTTPRKELTACPPAYCTTPSASTGTTT